MDRTYSIRMLLDAAGILGAVASALVALFLTRWWKRVKEEGVHALHDSLVQQLVGAGAEQVSARFGRWRELVRRELAACAIVVVRAGPDAGPEREVIERMLRLTFARVLDRDADVPPGTPVVCVGLDACHAALAGRRHDLPLVLMSGTARLDSAKLAATEASYVPANTPISAVVWARAVAAACVEPTVR